MREIDIATKSDINELNSLISIINKDKSHDHNYCDFDEDDFCNNDKKIVFVTRNSNQITCFLSLHCKTSFQKDLEGTFEIFAHPDFKGQGYSSALINQVEAYIIDKTSIKILKIGVLNNNPKAKKLYSALGYTSSGKDGKGEKFYKILTD